MNTSVTVWDWKKWMILVLAVATALIHFSLNFIMGKLDILFTLNGLGYLGLAALYLLPFDFLKPYKKWVRFVFIAFTVLTIILWIFLGQPYTTIGYVDKVIEVLLVLILIIDHRKVN